ncbi:hypothetical protein E2562_032193 [Oryza meyeriana var. granulata]|uniref:CASP-like protein n=1 Tax=Oryza meyeriana var. granulata TaxID=110450 RepID=A0A6G1F0E9_9ORYZ|nr:hypothetical protein E2562_032193 [Oryza meyeriana var. granulata]
MKDPPGAPGTPGGLGLRLVQAFFSAAALAVMASTDDFPSVSAFWFVAEFSWIPSPLLLVFLLSPTKSCLLGLDTLKLVW